MVRRNDVPVLTFFRTNGFAGGPYVQLELVDSTDAWPPGAARRRCDALIRSRSNALDDGAFWRVAFGGSKGNVLDAALMEALAERVSSSAPSRRQLKARLPRGRRARTSRSAPACQEHLPGRGPRRCSRASTACCWRCSTAACRCWPRCAASAWAAGWSWRSLCHRVFAAPDARLGQPEIALGRLRARRVARAGRRASAAAHADDLCLTGRLGHGRRGRRMGLVDEIGRRSGRGRDRRGRARTCCRSRRRACARGPRRRAPACAPGWPPSCRRSSASTSTT